MYRVLAVALALGTVSFATPTPLEAQAEDTIDPREAFRLGNEAASEERWADSEQWFRRAYELSGVPSALFNRAVALRALGRHVEARNAFRVLLSEDIDERVRETALDLLRESEGRVITLDVTGLEAAVEHAIQVNGADREDDLSRPLVLETDVGACSLLVIRPGFEPFQWTAELRPGPRQAVAVLLSQTPERTVVVTEVGTVLDEPFFWVLVGVGVIGAAAVGIGVGFAEAQLQPTTEIRFDL